MNVLVTGAKGQLGNEIRLYSGQFPDYNFHFTDIDDLDITNISNLNKFLIINPIDVIINCASYNAVDLAESNKEIAYAVNTMAVKHLAEVSAQNNIVLIHISTDYVFDGQSNKPYAETDLTNPLTIYGRSKLDGESQVRSLAKKAIIIRTSWLYSEFGQNFVKTVLNYGQDRGELHVVFDQIGTPTSAKDLANVILSIIPQVQMMEKTELFHYSNEGVASWFDFAKAIIEISGIDCKVHPIVSKEYPTPAPRPYYSVLSKKKIKEHFDISIPYWRESLRNFGRDPCKIVAVIS